MKKTILMISLLVLAMTLSACGNKTNTTTGSEDVKMTTETILLVGTMKLKGTEQEVDAEQAATLLPLWQMYQSLLMSDTTAQEEVDSVIKQIQKNMTSEQMDAIEAMELNQEDVPSAMQELGLAMIPGGDGISATPDFSMMPEDFSGGTRPDFSSGTAPEGFPEGGFVPGGGSIPGGGMPPGGGEGMIVEGGFDPGTGDELTGMTSSTAEAFRSGSGRRDSQFTLMLVRVVTEYLRSLLQP